MKKVMIFLCTVTVFLHGFAYAKRTSHDQKKQIPQSLISKIIKQNLFSIKECYSQQIIKKPHLAGKLVYTFIIDLDGHVTSIKTTENTLKDSIVDVCVAFH